MEGSNRQAVRIARRGLLLICLLGGSIPVVCQEEGRQVSIAEAVEQALEQSGITRAGSPAFRLHAHIAASGKAQPEYSAEVEEDWVSPEKWRRTVRAREFSQTLIANSGRISETLSGDYYPFWLQDLVSALFDPLPMAEQLKRMRGQLEIPDDSTRSHSCLNMQAKTGIAPIQNTVDYAFCFGGRLGLLHAVATPGYRAQFADYEPFAGKLVARSITADFAPGLQITAAVTELRVLDHPDESLFAVERPTPAEEQIKSSQVGEDSARVLALRTPEIVWPPVREGATAGVLSLYISTDRAGHVREAWPVAGDNPAMMDAARSQVLRWQYKPYLNAGVSQMEAVLTFAFSTRIEDPIATLTDLKARRLAARIVEPRIEKSEANGQTQLILRALVDESGNVLTVTNSANAPPALYAAGAAALKKWRFRPYMNHGRPDRFYAEIVFAVH